MCVSVDGEDGGATRSPVAGESTSGSSKCSVGGLSSSVSSAGRGDGCECVLSVVGGEQWRERGGVGVQWV